MIILGGLITNLLQIYKFTNWLQILISETD